MFAKPKGIPVEERDFPQGKGYSAAQRFSFWFLTYGQDEDLIAKIPDERLRKAMAGGIKH